MFNLIISIIAISLVCVLALSSIYYGGEAFRLGAQDADNMIVQNKLEYFKSSLIAYRDSEGAFPSEGTLEHLAKIDLKEYLPRTKKLDHFSEDILGYDKMRFVNLGAGDNFVIAQVPIAEMDGFTPEHCVSISKKTDVSCTINEGMRATATLAIKVD